MTTGTGPTIGTATARDDWEERISLRSDEREPPPSPTCRPPAGSRPRPGAATSRCAGSRSRAPSATSSTAPRPARRAPTLEPVDHLGGDVLAVPDTWYVDTTGEPGTTYDYAVASVPTVTECGVARRRRHRPPR